MAPVLRLKVSALITLVLFFPEVGVMLSFIQLANSKDSKIRYIGFTVQCLLGLIMAIGLYRRYFSLTKSNPTKTH